MNKPNKVKTANNSKKQITEKLAEIGLTIDEAKQWLKRDEEHDELPSTWNRKCCASPWDCDRNNFNCEANETSNVIFAAGNTPETTRVYVDDVPVEGIIRAKLEYDTELGVPTLQLDILNPKIALATSCEKF
jgi:hypothetical protein